MKLAPQNAWGEIPADTGGLRIAPIELDSVTEVMVLDATVASLELEKALGLALPEPSRSASKGEVRVLWSGRESVLALGSLVEIEGAVCVEQSDGWAALELSGPVREVLARLCPLDLRDAAFPPGATARTLLHQVGVSLTRLDDEWWLLLVPRTMTGTVLTDLCAAAVRVAAR